MTGLGDASSVDLLRGMAVDDQRMLAHLAARGTRGHPPNRGWADLPRVAARRGAVADGVWAVNSPTFPTRHGRYVDPHRGVAVGLRDLRVAA